MKEHPVEEDAQEAGDRRGRHVVAKLARAPSAPGVPGERLVERVPALLPGRGVFAGVRFLLRDRLLGPLTGANAVVEMAFQALFAAIPVLVYVRYGADARIAGWLFAAWGAGSLLGNVVVNRILRSAPLLPLGCAGMLLQSLAVWLLVPEAPAAAVGGALLCLGLFNGLYAAPMFGVLTARTPPPLRAKVLTANVTVTMIAGPLGLAGAGSALEAFGTQPVLLTISLVWTAAAVAFVLASLRSLAAGRAPFRARTTSTRSRWRSAAARSRSGSISRGTAGFR